MEPDRSLAQAHEYFDAGRYQEAHDLLVGLLAQNPDSSAILRSLGLVSIRLGRSAQAARYCRQAVQVDANDGEAHFSLALLYLLHGNYEQGWIEYEWRLMRSNCVAHRYAHGAKLWDGRSLQDESLMLHCEQGFGDNLQFIRFLPLLRERVKKIYLACHPELVRLFAGLEGIAGIVTDGQPLPSFQFHCPLLSLARHFKVTLASLPGPIPYLPVQAPSARPSGQPRIGLVWRASRTLKTRSLTLATLRTLASLPVQWVSLQKDPDDAERKILQDEFHADEQGSAFRDFQDTAESLATLDLLLTVDTSVAHLAGALGRPTWLLLSRWPDWRWLLDRPDNPWYPTMTLFRQKTEGDWSEPLAAITSRFASIDSRLD